MKVTRIAYSRNLNHGKYARLEEQAIRLGRVRSLVWRLYGSTAGAGFGDRTIRDRRAKLRSVAEQAEQRGDRAKAQRIRDHNLGTLKRERRSTAWECRIRDITFQAVHAVADKAGVIVAEDLTKTFSSRKKLGKNTNRRLAAWTKGVTAEALHAVSDRRGSAVRLVNAAYTSQVIPFTDILGVRKGDRLHCTGCGAVWQADHAAAINILRRDGDPDITRYTPHTRVGQLLRERADRHRSRLPDQDSSTQHLCQCGERNIHPHPTMGKE